uniref:Saposin B-type domain-containing protein n=1 Tax=Panagrolaimus sp. JU765 TaxID=591449 RepID=A0AC34RRY2_9BILA
MDIVREQNLTKGQIRSEIEQWAASQSTELQQAFAKVESEIDALKKNLTDYFDGKALNLSTTAREFYDEYKAIFQSEDLTMKDESLRPSAKTDRFVPEKIMRWITVFASVIAILASFYLSNVSSFLLLQNKAGMDNLANLILKHDQESTGKSLGCDLCETLVESTCEMITGPFYSPRFKFACLVFSFCEVLISNNKNCTKLDCCPSLGFAKDEPQNNFASNLALNITIDCNQLAGFAAGDIYIGLVNTTNYNLWPKLCNTLDSSCPVNPKVPMCQNGPPS